MWRHACHAWQAGKNMVTQSSKHPLNLKWLICRSPPFVLLENDKHCFTPKELMRVIHRETVQTSLYSFFFRASHCFRYKIPTGSSKLFTPSQMNVGYAKQDEKWKTWHHSGWWTKQSPFSQITVSPIELPNMQPKIKPHRLKKKHETTEATQLVKRWLQKKETLGTKTAGDLKSYVLFPSHNVCFRRKWGIRWFLGGGKRFHPFTSWGYDPTHPR